jgi:hypothetical protein
MTYLIGTQVLTVVTMKRQVFSVVIQGASEKFQRFGGTYHLHVQGRKVSQVKKQQKLEESLSLSELHGFTTTLQDRP